MEYRFNSYGVQCYGGDLVQDGVLADFPLVGSNVKPSSELCNVFSRNFGCLNHKGHVGKDLPVNVSGEVCLDGKVGCDLAVIKPHAFHCFDPLCPSCCLAWANRLCGSALVRFKVFGDVFGEGFEVHHITVSVPECDWRESLSFMRKQMVSFCECVGVVGGCAIYHPKRYDRVLKCWFFSPHFHVLGFVEGGRVDGLCVRDVHNLTGYVLKRLEDRKSLRMTLLYQLSHAGVVGRGKTVSWFGNMVFKKNLNDDVKVVVDADLRDEKRRHKEGGLCPVCGEVLVHVCRVAKAGGFDYAMFEDQFVLDCVDNWVKVPEVYRKRKKKVGIEGDGYPDYEKEFADYEASLGGVVVG